MKSNFWMGLFLTIGVVLIVTPFTMDIEFPIRGFMIIGIAIVCRVFVDIFVPQKGKSPDE